MEAEQSSETVRSFNPFR